MWINTKRFRCNFRDRYVVFSMEDNAACLWEMLQNVSEGYHDNQNAEMDKAYNPDAPTDNGPNTFMMINDPVYRDYWTVRPVIDFPDPLANWSKPYFEPEKMIPMTPSVNDFLPEPVIITQNGASTNAQDEFVFSPDGVILRINCSRTYEVDAPNTYTESQIKYIVENLPRIPEREMDRHARRAAAASGKLKDHHIDGKVELDFSEVIRFRWSDGTVSEVPRDSFPNADKEDVIDVHYEETNEE